MKRGQIGRFLPFLFFGAIIALIFALVAIPVAYMGDEVLDELKTNDDVSTNNETVNRINQVQSLITPAFDQLVFIILVAFVLGSFILAIFTDFHPIVVLVLVLAIILLIIVGGLMANIYDEVADNNILSNKSEEFTFTNSVMGAQLPIIIGVVGLVAIIIVLAKRGGATTPI